MKAALALMCSACFLIVSNLTAQGNVGVGTETPSEKLEVSGIIYTNQGGIRFPDETLQETAAFNSGGPGEASMPYGQVYLTIKTTNPGITDTMRIVDVSAGGVKTSGGPSDLQEYVMIKEMDAVTPVLVQKCVQGTLLTDIRLHFLDSEGDLHKTIELRDAFLTEIKHLNIHRKDNEFAHLEELRFVGVKLEVRHFFPNGTTACYCWDFALNAACTCN